MGEGYFYCDFGGIKVPKAIKKSLISKNRSSPHEAGNLEISIFMRYVKSHEKK